MVVGEDADDNVGFLYGIGIRFAEDMSFNLGKVHGKIENDLRPVVSPWCWKGDCVLERKGTLGEGFAPKVPKGEALKVLRPAHGRKIVHHYTVPCIGLFGAAFKVTHVGLVFWGMPWEKISR
jgi:hypothetical protein